MPSGRTDEQSGFEHKGVSMSSRLGATPARAMKKEAEPQALIGSLSQKLEDECARSEDLERRNIRVRRESERMRLSALRMLKLENEERRLVARDLQDCGDHVCQMLETALVSLSNKLPADESREAQDALRLLQQLEHKMQATAYSLHPPLLDDKGLAEALKWHVRALSEQARVNIALNVQPDLERLPPELELLVFRLVRRCLAGIHRVPGRRKSSVSITKCDEALFVEICDSTDGTPKAIATDQMAGPKLVVPGLEDRVRQFGGEVEMEGSGAENRILVTLPLGTDPEPYSW